MSSQLSDYNTKKSSNVARNTVFSDLDLRFRRHPNTSDIRPLTDIEAIKNAVKNLLLTNSGDRPFHPEIGSGITDLLFENADPYVANVLKENIKLVLTRFEPRISNIAIEINDDPDNNAYFVQLTFNATNSQLPQEVGFYLERLR